MKLKEAIEIVAVIPDRNPNLAGNEFEEALKILIEAGKLINQQPPEGYTCIPRPLPGEES